MPSSLLKKQRENAAAQQRYRLHRRLKKASIYYDFKLKTIELNEHQLLSTKVSTAIHILIERFHYVVQLSILT